jgi:hypothetical protein
LGQFISSLMGNSGGGGTINPDGSTTPTNVSPLQSLSNAFLAGSQAGQGQPGQPQLGYGQQPGPWGATPQILQQLLYGSNILNQQAAPTPQPVLNKPVAPNGVPLIA